jgi:uncharacterized repeat protein (TIGR03803 family)
MDGLRQGGGLVSAPWRTGRTAAALAVTFLVLAACAAQAQNYNEETIYSFRGSPDGANPYGGVTQDSAGNLYGTTYQGGHYNLGTVFKLDTAGKETVLHSFGGQQDGAYPMGVTLVLDSAQNLYGTTSDGGGGYGVIFTMNARGKETVLRILKQWNGATPYASVIRDADGNVYATAAAGGGENGGVVFKVTGVRKGKILHSFMGGEYGRYPEAPLVEDAKGNFYGTTYYGGSCCGIVFKLNKNGSETPLHSFTSGNGVDGFYPEAGLVLDGAGNLYGTTSQGGVGGINGGAVFKVDTAGNETVLHTFDGADGWSPGFGSLLRDSDGNLFGTTQGSGTGCQETCGSVFELTPKSGGGWTATVLYTFSGGSDGGAPLAGLIQDGAGNLYGTTSAGGAYGYGVVFKLSPK